MSDLKKLVRELIDAENDAGQNGHTDARHARIIAATEAVRAEADARHREYAAVGHIPGYLFTITAEHVRDPRATLGQEYYAVAACMGRLLKRDIGKRVFRRGDVVQVESDEQRDTRQAREATADAARNNYEGTPFGLGSA